MALKFFITERADAYSLEETSLPVRRVSRPKHLYAEEGHDERPVDPAHLWLNETFYHALDAALSKIHENFHSQREVLKSVSKFYNRQFEK